VSGHFGNQKPNQRGGDAGMHQQLDRATEQMLQAQSDLSTARDRTEDAGGG